MHGTGRVKTVLDPWPSFQAHLKWHFQIYYLYCSSEELFPVILVRYIITLLFYVIFVFFHLFYFLVFIASCYAGMLHYYFVVVLTLLRYSEAYSKPCQTSKMERFECTYVIALKSMVFFFYGQKKPTQDTKVSKYMGWVERTSQ